MSLTYILVILLGLFASYLGVEISDSDLQTAVNVIVAIVLACGALYGRYRAGGLTLYGKRTH